MVNTTPMTTFLRPSGWLILLAVIGLNARVACGQGLPQSSIAEADSPAFTGAAISQIPFRDGSHPDIPRTQTTVLRQDSATALKTIAHRKQPANGQANSASTPMPASISVDRFVPLDHSQWVSPAGVAPCLDAYHAGAMPPVLPLTKGAYRYGDFGATSYPQTYRQSGQYRDRTDWVTH